MRSGASSMMACCCACSARAKLYPAASCETRELLSCILLTPDVLLAQLWNLVHCVERHEIQQDVSMHSFLHNMVQNGMRLMSDNLKLERRGRPRKCIQKQGLPMETCGKDPANQKISLGKDCLHLCQLRASTNRCCSLTMTSAVP